MTAQTQAEALRLAQECADYATSLRSTIMQVKLEGRAEPASMVRAAGLFERVAARIAELEAQAQPARAASDVQAIKLGMQAHEEACSKHCTGTTYWAWSITRFYERAHGITKEKP